MCSQMTKAVFVLVSSRTWAFAVMRVLVSVVIQRTSASYCCISSLLMLLSELQAASGGAKS